jgi:hypothetical protein
VQWGGDTVGAGGVHVESGGLEVKGGITLLSGALKLTTPDCKQGLDVSGGGLRASTSELTAAALTAAATAAATAAGFAGAVLRLEASHADLSAPFKLVQA